MSSFYLELAISFGTCLGANERILAVILIPVKVHLNVSKVSVEVILCQEADLNSHGGVWGMVHPRACTRAVCHFHLHWSPELFNCCVYTVYMLLYRF